MTDFFFPLTPVLDVYIFLIYSSLVKFRWVFSDN